MRKVARVLQSGCAPRLQSLSVYSLYTSCSFSGPYKILVVGSVFFSGIALWIKLTLPNNCGQSSIHLGEPGRYTAAPEFQVVAVVKPLANFPHSLTATVMIIRRV
jgi:hypothetical protein